MCRRKVSHAVTEQQDHCDAVDSSLLTLALSCVSSLDFFLQDDPAPRGKIKALHCFHAAGEFLAFFFSRPHLSLH